MTDVLLKHINTLCKLTEDAAEQVAQSFDTVDLKKKQVVLQEGERCTHIYFVAKGCLRMFFTDDKGTEQTIQFALENWWMTDLNAFNKRGISSISIQALESATLLAISKKDLDALLDAQPILERYFRSIYERAYSASLTRMRFFKLPKDEFYRLFSTAYPNFIQRVPQKILASFLGFTPEYMSELRKKSIS